MCLNTMISLKNLLMIEILDLLVDFGLYYVTYWVLDKLYLMLFILK